MSEQEVLEKIKGIVAKQLSYDKEITKESSFMNDLGADSLDTVELVMAFEEEFGVEISDDEAAKMQTVKDVLDYINSNKKG